MSNKNKLETKSVESDVKVTQSVQGQQSVTPNVFKLKPLRIEQPIEIVQSVNLTGPTQPEEPVVAPAPVAEPAKVEKVKCKVRRAQKVWFVITLLLVVAAALAYAFVPTIYNFIRPDASGKLAASNAGAAFADWNIANHLFTFGLVCAATFVVSVLVRFILHPITCKGRKGKHCCFSCEAIKFFWTMFFFGFGVAALFWYFDLYSTKKVLDGILNIFKTFSFSTVKANIFPCAVVAVTAVSFVVLTIVTFAHNAHDRRQAKLAARENAENEAYKANNQQSVYNPYITGVYEDINSPYNAYRTNRIAEPAKRKSPVATFFKVLGVLVVLAVAYAVVAYFVDALPLHDFLNNLF